jgi:hypothetical protein
MATETFIGDVRIRSTDPVIVVGGQSPEGADEIPDAPPPRPPIDLAGPVTIKLDGDGREITIGGNPTSGSTATIHLNGKNGDITVRDSAGNPVFRFINRFALLEIGGTGNEGDIRVRNNADEVTIHLDGNSGDIKLIGADCAEQFDVLESERIEPGSVLVIDDNGQLAPCRMAYDSRVAGVVSGANGLSPGIILDNRSTPNNRAPIALSGKVYCWVDAQYGPIKIGDLLTTSATPGMAMKADDPLQAFGAVIGKALQPVYSGRGMIPILVALQ